ncbi:MAG: putative porin [Verrucomicrobia bacterium]|nr:putative porin [Verrucomicrobiota bacterium]
MFNLKSKWLALLGTALLAVGPVLAQDSGPLIDLLVKKGLVTDQEAEELRVDLVKDFVANTSAGKLNLSSSLSEFKISGDLRMRHQYETQAPALAAGSTAAKVTNERVRERFRFRLNGDVILQKGWTAGFALETGQAADSGNQTFQGGNDDYSIFLARAYVGWSPNQNWAFVFGKQKQPIYATDLRWDADINPQGASEVYKYFVGSKDTFEVRALQNIFDDRNEVTAGPNGRDAWLFEQQAVYTHWFGKEQLNSVIIAPGFSKYSDSVIASANGTTNENPFTNATAGASPGSTRYLSLMTLAGEANWASINGAGTSFKLYWDSAYNFEAASRVRKVYGLPLGTWNKDAFAWLVGVGYAYGNGKVAGDYSLKLDYRSIGLGSTDVNTSDSDFGFGKLNQEGFKFATSYNVTDFASLGLNYFYTTAQQKNLTYTLANNDHSQLLQLDLLVKF